MEIVNDGAAAQVEEILAHPSIAGTSPLPLTNMGQGVFHSDPFTQFGSSFCRYLTLSSLDRASLRRDECRCCTLWRSWCIVL
jgi:hypothetical protein